MKVKTFTGTHRFAVDRQVNDWLAKSNVTVRKTDVAFKALRDRGWDAVSYDDAPSGRDRNNGLVRRAIQSKAKTKTGHLDFQIWPIASETG